MNTKRIVSVAAGLLLGTVSTQALADVFVTGAITKDKDVTITESIVKLKAFAISSVTDQPELDGAAETLAIINVVNTGNIVDKSQQEGVPQDLLEWGYNKTAEIIESINDNSGIIGVNQDVGNMVNQGNIVSIAVLGDDLTSADAFSHAEAWGDQVNTDNFVHHESFLADPIENTVADIAAAIDSSVNGNSGVVGVNQNGGNMNNQHNILAMSVAFNSVVALSDSALGQVNTGNEVVELETFKIDSISNSASGNTGVVGINQSVGNMNNQMTAISFAALTSTANISVPGLN